MVPYFESTNGTWVIVLLGSSGISTFNAPEKVVSIGFPNSIGSGEIVTLSTLTLGHGPNLVVLLLSWNGVAFAIDSVANKMNNKISFHEVEIIVLL